MQRFLLWVQALPIAPMALTFLGACLWPEMELLVPSLPDMKNYFGVSEGEIQQLLSTNFIGFLCGIFLAGPLCDRFGRKKVCIVGTFCFLVSSLAAVFAPSFFWLMAARFMQGLAVTAPIIAGSALLIELTRHGSQIFWMSISSATITLSMALAPLLGSWLNSILGFQGNLWALFLAACIGIVPVILWVPESLPPDKRTKLNTTAIIDSYYQLIKNGRFIGMSIVISGFPAAYWVYTGVSSLYMIDYLKMDPASFGRYQGPIVGTFALISLSISSINKRIGTKNCLLAGFFIMLIGSSALLFLALMSIDDALLTTIFMMFFVGGMVPVNSLLFPSALNLLPLELQGSGQSMIQAIRLFIASIGTIILSAVYQGPFLPVAVILTLVFLGGSLLLWRMRRMIASSTDQQIIAGH